MKTILTSLVALLSFQLIHAQQVLTLEQAILEQRSSLAPEKLKGIQWIPGTKDISYVENDQLLIRTFNEPKQSKSIGLSELKKAFGSELDGLKSWPRIKWISSNEFYFQQKATIYFVETSGEGVAKISLSEKEGVAHLDMHVESRNVTFTRNNNLYCFHSGKEQVVIENEDKNIVCGQAVHRYEFGISKGTFWSPKGDFLAFYRNDQTDVTDYPLVDVNSTPASLNNIKYPMAGAKSEKVTLGIYHVELNKTVFLETDTEKDTYLTNISWSPDQKYVYVAVLNRDQNHMRLNQYDASNGKLVKTLFEEKHDKYVEPLHPLYFINGKSDQFVWWSQKDGYMHLYLYANTGKEIRQLTKGEWVVKKWLGQGADGKFIYVEGTGSKPTETYIYKVNVANGKFSVLDETPGTHAGQLNGEQGMIIDQFSSTTVPGMTWISDHSGKNKVQLVKAENPLKNYNVSTPELMTVTKDDRNFYCRMIKPTSFDETKKYPVLVYVYNGPHAQLVRNQWLGGAPMWMYEMAERGYIIFTLDGRGSANRGLAFEQEIFRRIGDVELEDQLTGVEYLKSLSFVDVDRMAIHGWSYGGFMTISMMLRHPDVFKVGVAGGPVVDWKYYEVMYTERYMDTPQTNPDGFQKSAVLNYVPQLKGKLLSIHGLVDDVVVPQHNFQFLKTCVDEKVQVDFFAYPGHPHNVRGKDRVHLMTKVLDYIEQGLNE